VRTVHVFPGSGLDNFASAHLSCPPHDGIDYGETATQTTPLLAYGISSGLQSPTWLLWTPRRLDTLQLAHWATMSAWLCTMNGEEVDLVEASLECGNEEWNIPWILHLPLARVRFRREICACLLRLSLQLLRVFQRDESPNRQYYRDFPASDYCLSRRPPADCQSCVYETREKRKEASPTRAKVC